MHSMLRSVSSQRERINAQFKFKVAIEAVLGKGKLIVLYSMRQVGKTTLVGEIFRR